MTFLIETVMEEVKLEFAEKNEFEYPKESLETARFVSFSNYQESDGGSKFTEFSI